jgi:phage gp46-like protein
MRDLALAWNAASGTADLAMNPQGIDLLTDDGLETAIIISLFTDRLANPGDAIPDGTTDHRGWWGDMPIDVNDQGRPPADLIGSRLWLLENGSQVPETLRRAETYAREALAWMIEDGVAGSVTATASFPALGWIDLVIEIEQAGSRRTFSYAWSQSPNPLIEQ